MVQLPPVIQAVVNQIDHQLLHDPFPNTLCGVPLQPWEGELMKVLDISKDHLRIVLAVAASAFVGFGLRLFRSPTLRHLYALITGAALVYYAHGGAILHALAPASLTYVAMFVAPKKAGVLAWLINFPYLLYLHLASNKWYNAEAGELDFTGALMVLVLKMISLAVCYQDHRVKKKEHLSPYQAEHVVHAMPNPLEFFSFIFCTGTLLSGPYFEFSEFKDFMEHKGVWDAKKAKQPPYLLKAITLILKSVFFMGCFLFMMPRFNMDKLFQEPYLSMPFWQKCVVQTITGITSQFKYCFLWTLSEAGMTFAGFDFVQWDEKGRAVWGRCSNIHFFVMLACDSARMVAVHWNVCTGNFLRRYVYERLAPRGKRPGFPQLMATQLVSALWHGLWGGQFVMFASTALAIHFSGVIHKFEQTLLPGVLARSAPWWLFKVLWTNYVSNSLVLGFHVLELHKCLFVYGTNRWLVHWVCLVGSLLGTLLPKPRREKKEKGGHSHPKTE